MPPNEYPEHISDLEDQNRDKRKSVALVVSINKGKPGEPPTVRINTTGTVGSPQNSNCALDQQIINSKYDELIATMYNILEQVQKRPCNNKHGHSTPKAYDSGDCDYEDCDDDSDYDDSDDDDLYRRKHPWESKGSEASEAIQSDEKSILQHLLRIDSDSEGSDEDSEDMEKVKTTPKQASDQSEEDSPEEKAPVKDKKHKHVIESDSEESDQESEDSEKVKAPPIKTLQSDEDSPEENSSGKDRKYKPHINSESEGSDQDSVDREKIKITQIQASIETEENSSEENPPGEDKKHKHITESDSEGSDQESLDREKIKVKQIQASIETEEDSSEENPPGKGGKYKPYTDSGSDGSDQDSLDREKIKVKQIEASFEVDEESSEENVSGKADKGKHHKAKPDSASNGSDEASVDIERIKVKQLEASFETSDESTVENYKPDYKHPSKTTKTIADKSLESDENIFLENVNLLKLLLERKEPGVTKNIPPGVLSELLKKVAQSTDSNSSGDNEKIGDEDVAQALQELIDQDKNGRPTSEISKPTKDIVKQIVNNLSDEDVSSNTAAEILRNILDREVKKDNEGPISARLTQQPGENSSDGSDENLKKHERTVKDPQSNGSSDESDDLDKKIQDLLNKENASKPKGPHSTIKDIPYSDESDSSDERKKEILDKLKKKDRAIENINKKLEKTEDKWHRAMEYVRYLLKRVLDVDCVCKNKENDRLIPYEKPSSLSDESTNYQNKYPVSVESVEDDVYQSPKSHQNRPKVEQRLDSSIDDDSASNSDDGPAKHNPYKKPVKPSHSGKHTPVSYESGEERPRKKIDNSESCSDEVYVKPSKPFLDPRKNLDESPRHKNVKAVKDSSSGSDEEDTPRNTHRYKSPKNVHSSDESNSDLTPEHTSLISDESTDYPKKKPYKNVDESTSDSEGLPIKNHRYKEPPSRKNIDDSVYEEDELRKYKKPKVYSEEDGSTTVEEEDPIDVYQHRRPKAKQNLHKSNIDDEISSASDLSQKSDEDEPTIREIITIGRHAPKKSDSYDLDDSRLLSSESAGYTEEDDSRRYESKIRIEVPNKKRQGRDRYSSEDDDDEDELEQKPNKHERKYQNARPKGRDQGRQKRGETISDTPDIAPLPAYQFGEIFRENIRRGRNAENLDENSDDVPDGGNPNDDVEIITGDDVVIDSEAKTHDEVGKQDANQYPTLDGDSGEEPDELVLENNDQIVAVGEPDETQTGLSAPAEDIGEPLQDNNAQIDVAGAPAEQDENESPELREQIVSVRDGEDIDQGPEETKAVDPYDEYAKEIGEIFDSIETDEKNKDKDIIIHRPVYTLSEEADNILLSSGSEENANVLSPNNNYGVDLKEFLRELKAAEASQNQPTPVEEAKPVHKIENDESSELPDESGPTLGETPAESSNDNSPPLKSDPERRISITDEDGNRPENDSSMYLTLDSKEQIVVASRGGHKIPLKVKQDANGRYHLLLNKKCLCSSCRRKPCRRSHSRRPANKMVIDIRVTD